MLFRWSSVPENDSARSGLLRIGRDNLAVHQAVTPSNHQIDQCPVNRT